MGKGSGLLDPDQMGLDDPVGKEAFYPGRSLST